MGQFRKVLFWSGGRPGGRVGEMENKASNLKLTEAELGKNNINIIDNDNNNKKHAKY